MYPENKLLSCIIGFIIFVMIVVIIWMNYVINNNKKAVTFFNLDEIKEISYSNNTDKFKIEKDKLYLTIDNETILDGIKYEFDATTGSFKYKDSNDDLYLRSIGRTNVTLWYKYKIYVFEKDVIAN